VEKSAIQIAYRTADRKQIHVEVSTAVKELLEQTDRQIRSQRRQDRRHIYREGYIDGLTDTTNVHPHEDFADIVYRKDRKKQLYSAMQMLTGVQSRRLFQYYFNGLSLRQIGEIEGVNHKAVACSVKQAIKKLHGILSD